RQLKLLRDGCEAIGRRGCVAPVLDPAQVGARDAYALREVAKAHSGSETEQTDGGAYVHAASVIARAVDGTTTAPRRSSLSCTSNSDVVSLTTAASMGASPFGAKTRS